MYICIYVYMYICIYKSIGFEPFIRDQQIISIKNTHTHTHTHAHTPLPRKLQSYIQTLHITNHILRMTYDNLSLSLPPSLSLSLTHARTHARTHAHTHTRTHTPDHELRIFWAKTSNCQKFSKVSVLADFLYGISEERTFENVLTHKHIHSPLYIHV